MFIHILLNHHHSLVHFGALCASELGRETAYVGPGIEHSGSGKGKRTDKDQRTIKEPTSPISAIVLSWDARENAHRLWIFSLAKSEIVADFRDLC